MKFTHKESRIKKFLFPFYPHKCFKNSKLMMLLAALLALKILFGFIHVKIPGINLAIGFAYVPIMICGWFFGPIIGFIFGAISDTIGFLTHPTSVWFWMYAIVEPTIGMWSGLIHGCFYLRNKNNKTIINLVFDVFFQQIFLVGFILVCFFGLIFWSDQGKKPISSVCKILLIILVSLYFVFMEVLTFLYLIRAKNNINQCLIFIYSTLLVTSIITVTSFLLGPISTVEYLRYINGVYPDAWVRYGMIYYLVPRIIVQCLKTPIESIVLASLILLTQNLFDDYINNLNNRWETDY